jgi:hypothetical protein
LSVSYSQIHICFAIPPQCLLFLIYYIEQKGF